MLRRTTAVASLALLTAAGGLAVSAPASAAATNRYVATSGSDGANPVNDCTDQAHPCRTIQHAVDEAQAGDTVSVAAGTYPETVSVTTSLTVTGSTTGSTTVAGVSGPTFTISPGQGPDPAAVTLSHLDLSGNAQGVGVDAFGTGATLTVEDSTVSHNALGGVAVQAGTLHVARTKITDNPQFGVLIGQATATVSDSTVARSGASKDSSFEGVGIGVYSGSLHLSSSTVADNAFVGVYVVGSGLGLAAAAADPQPTVVEDSTVSGNGLVGVANGLGSAVDVRTSTLAGNGAAGVFAELSTTAVSDSTITGTVPTSIALPGPEGQTLPQGGLVYLDSAPELASDARATALERVFSPGRRIDVAGRTLAMTPRRTDAVAPQGLSVRGSIVAKNGTLPDCIGQITDGGYNLSSDKANSCAFSAAEHDLVKTDPKLGALADNGGATRTVKPLKGSPAIDAIPGGAAGCVAGAADQRGVSRPQPTHGPCDIGAVELAATPIVIHPDSLPHGTVGQAYHARITATGGAYPTYLFSLAPGSALPPGLSMDGHGHVTGTPTKHGTFRFTVSVNDPVLRDYTIVVEDAAASGNGDQPISGNGDQPISATGAPVLSMTAVGAGTVFAGFLLMVGAGFVGRRPGRHRIPKN